MSQLFLGIDKQDIIFERRETDEVRPTVPLQMPWFSSWWHFLPQIRKVEPRRAAVLMTWGSGVPGCGNRGIFQSRIRKKRIVWGGCWGMSWGLARELGGGLDRWCSSVRFCRTRQSWPATRMKVINDACECALLGDTGSLSQF